MIRLSAYTSRAWVPALVGELRSCKLHSVSKKEMRDTERPLCPAAPHVLLGFKMREEELLGGAGSWVMEC